MWTKSFANLFLLTSVAALAPSHRFLESHGGDEGGGSFWAVYNATAAPADASCLLTAGMVVDDSCCESTDAVKTMHSMLQGNDTCFTLGPGLIPFSGCVGDHVAGYGEICDGGGMAPFNAANATECGCTFQIAGDGCYKANDIPGQQWFVYLDGEKCHDHDDDDKDDDKDGDGDSGGAYNKYTMAQFMVTFALATFAWVF